MEKTEHILLAGDGANEFAREMKIELADDEYFFTDFRYRQLLEARRKHKIQLDHTANEPELIEESESAKTKSQISNPKSQIGTVGAVACDSSGNLAAATSTAE
jgi:beta-aspartyl-peptidase (threonine type)